MRWLVWLSVAVVSGAASAQEFERALEAGYGFDSLSGRYDNWQSAYLQYEQPLSDETLGYVRFNQTQRFDLSDNELLSGVYHRLNEDWQLFAEIGGSGTQQVRPELQGQVVVSRSLTDGYLLSFGAHRTHWAVSTSQGYSAQIERYFGNADWGEWRWSYRLRQDHLLGGDNAVSHAATLSHFYNDWSSVTVAYSQGEEAEKIAAQRVLITEVKGLSVYGLHQLNSRWGLRWSLSFNEQGAFYDRRGVLVGLRYRF